MPYGNNLSAGGNNAMRSMAPRNGMGRNAMPGRPFGNDALPGNTGGMPGTPMPPTTPSGGSPFGQGMVQPPSPMAGGLSGPSFTFTPGQNKSPFNIPTTPPNDQAARDAALKAAQNVPSTFDAFMSGTTQPGSWYPQRALNAMKGTADQSQRESEERLAQAANYYLSTSDPEQQFSRYNLAAQLGVGSADLFRQLEDLQAQRSLAAQAQKIFGARTLS